MAKMISKRKLNMYLDYYDRECNSLDFVTFPKVKKQVFKYLKDEECPPGIRIMFGDWLCRKIYMNYKMTDEVKDEVSEWLESAIDVCQNLVSKGTYLQFHEMDVLNHIALYFYLNRFSRKDKFFILQLLNDTQLVKNYLQRPDISDEELKQHFLEWLEVSPVHEQKSNILDVLIRHYEKDPEIIEVREYMKWKDLKKGGAKTVYGDAQNVHDEDLSKTAIEAAQKMIEWDGICRNDEYKEEDKVNEKISHGEKVKPFKPRFDCLRSTGPGHNPADMVMGLLQNKFREPAQREVIKCVIERAKIDTTTYGKSGYTIADTLFALFNYIYNSPEKEALLQILMEEMDRMKELCSTGYVARFVSVIQGFDDRFQIQISFEKQLFAIASKIIADKLKDAPEKVVLGTVDDDHKVTYLSFIKDIVNENIYKLQKEYGKKDVDVNILTVLKDYTEYEGWTYSKSEGEVDFESDDVDFAEKETTLDF